MNLRCLDRGHVRMYASKTDAVCIRCGRHLTKGSPMLKPRRIAALLALSAALGLLWPFPATGATSDHAGRYSVTQGRY